MDDAPPVSLHSVLKRMLFAVVAAVLWTGALLTGVAVLPSTLGVVSVWVLALGVSITPTVLLMAMGDPWRPRLRVRLSIHAPATSRPIRIVEPYDRRQEDRVTPIRFTDRNDQAHDDAARAGRALDGYAA
jgi:hypothetical protein